MKPTDLGLPARFKDWRPGQWEIVQQISDSLAYAYLLDAPTGTGKSLIGVATYANFGLSQAVLERLTGEDADEDARYRCVYVTRTKQLQDQILKEFPMAKTIKGRSNYRCAKFPDKFPEFNADHCTGAKDCFIEEDGKKIPGVSRCEYLIQKRAAVNSPLAVLNDAYYLAEVNGPGQFSGATILVIDEVDSIESGLMNFIEFSVSESQLTSLGLNLKPPLRDDKMDQWIAWFPEAHRTLTIAASVLELQLSKIDTDLWSGVELDLQKTLKKIKSFGHKVTMIINDIKLDWIFMLGQDAKKSKKWTFKPVKVSEYAGQYLWRHADRVVGMSGTILKPEILANEIGLGRVIPMDTTKVNDWEYQKLPSPFKKEMRPVYFVPSANLAYATMQQELPKLANAVQMIIDHYPDDKILVHTWSYAIKEALLRGLDPTRVMSHNTKDREQRLALFKAGTQPWVMISPSFDRGVDLPDDQCRCVIICKVPFMDLSDLQTAARMKLPGGQLWYLTRTVQTIMQMSGRAVRNENDWCDCYILDNQFKRLFGQMGQTFPAWWREALKGKPNWWPKEELFE